jgi:hypothetical protein
MGGKATVGLRAVPNEKRHAGLGQTGRAAAVSPRYSPEVSDISSGNCRSFESRRTSRSSLAPDCRPSRRSAPFRLYLSEVGTSPKPFDVDNYQKPQIP